MRPDAEARESWEHDGLRWVPAADAPRLAIWPSYGESVRRVREQLLDPDLERVVPRWTPTGGGSRGDPTA